jgi:FAD/FMN-containing dehydrogenase
MDPHNSPAKDRGHARRRLAPLQTPEPRRQTARARIKPLGAGYSCSEASQPSDRAIALDTLSKLDKLLPLDHVRAGVSTSHLVRAEAGIRLQELAESLGKRGLALSNLGGFTKQTLAGVLSTATHGTGLTHSSLSDIVVSVDIVCVDASHQAAVHRFEPTHGITDPATFPAAAMQRSIQRLKAL